MNGSKIKFYEALCCLYLRCFMSQRLLLFPYSKHFQLHSKVRNLLVSKRETGMVGVSPASAACQKSLWGKRKRSLKEMLILTTLKKNVKEKLV